MEEWNATRLLTTGETGPLRPGSIRRDGSRQGTRAREARDGAILESGRVVTLEELFQLQDGALEWNQGTSPQVVATLGFIRDYLEFVTAALGSLGFGSDPSKQTVIRVLSVDALSGLVVATRTGLWGNVPESAVLLRTAIETLVILNGVVEEKAFSAFDYEMRSRLRRFEYDSCRARLGKRGKRFDGILGRLSNVGAHTSRTRIKYAEYKFEDLAHDRLGAALDTDAAETALVLIPDALQHLASIIEFAYDQDSRSFPLGSRLAELNARYKTSIQDCPSSPEGE